MMFVQFFIWGAWAVTLGTYLGTTLQFEGTQIGLIYGTTAIAAIVSPLFVGFVADRYFASQKVFSALHLTGAVFLYLASQASGFREIYALLLVYSLCYMPTLAIANGIGFRHLTDPDRQFPLVRVLGTIGWIVAGLVVGFLGVEDRNIPLQIAAGMSVLLAVYGFMLPDTPPKPSSEPQTVARMLGLDAFSLLRNRSFLVLFIASVLISIPLAFYYNFTNLFLNELGMENAAGKQTLGQQSEVLSQSVCSPGRFVMYCLRSGTLIPPPSGCCTQASCCMASATTSSSSPGRSMRTARHPSRSRTRCRDL
jgi:nucleoside transporter